MPASYLTLFPPAMNTFQMLKGIIDWNAAVTRFGSRLASLGVDETANHQDAAFSMIHHGMNFMPFLNILKLDRMLSVYAENAHDLMDFIKATLVEPLEQFYLRRKEEASFFEILTSHPSRQGWSTPCDKNRILCDLPSHRLIDISDDKPHRIKNYTVVFAPRAGHHSNIAERVAVFLREQGLTRIAVVEQKCAEEIPLYVDRKRHYEGFEGQVSQYRQMLERLATVSGHPSHLVAICQPGPLLMSTLILHPHLAKTFGSAGSPMHTEGEKGSLTDFVRLAGEHYIDILLAVLGRTVSGGHSGAGREYYDGRLQVFGFYCLGMDRHLRNFINLFTDLREGKKEDVERQKIFYQWYNYVHHSPAGFVRDTFKKIFINNELIRGTLYFEGKTIGINNYPASIPIWALGGKKDEITPPQQAVGHMPLIESVSSSNKLTLLCEAGHMGLFRSTKVLEQYYRRIAEFILTNSDMSDPGI